MGSRPNLSLLFGFGTINAEQPVHVGKTSFLGFITAAVSLVLSLIIFGAVLSFSQMPLSMELVLFASVAILVVTFRYLQLAIQLDRQGTSPPSWTMWTAKMFQMEKAEMSSARASNIPMQTG